MKHIQNSWVSVGLILFLVSFVFLFQYMKKYESKTNLVTLWSSTPPYSTDPIEYDASIHHICFRSVLSSVLTQYRLGKYEGILAESWDPSNDYKEWKFKIRNGLQFENGDEITPKHIVYSWMRMAYFQKKKNSQSGFLELLKGFEKITSPESSIPGLEIKDQVIIVRLVKPFKKLLETISFGLYSVVHPNDYNLKTGEWKNPTKIISSGGYKIESWRKESLELKRREDFLPEIRHPNAPKNILITWNPEIKFNSDIISGGSNDLTLNKERIFYGPFASDIAYVICVSWPDKNSICNSKEKRRFLRNEFYRAMIQAGVKPTYSFFPLTMANIKEASTDFKNNPKSSPPSKKGQSLKYVHTWSKNPFFDPFDGAMEKIAKKLNLKIQGQKIPLKKVRQEKNPLLKIHSFDFALLATGILIEDPFADIRFMFLSKEGIRLPDTDGRILKELANENFDPQKINELLWDQAVIWPIGHFSMGLWAKKHIDFSMLDTVLPPTDFQWIGLKN